MTRFALDGNPAIISRARLNNLERRVPGSSPQIKAYHVSRYVLCDAFGLAWLNENIAPSSTSSFFLNNFANTEQSATHVTRVINLAEMLFNLQWIAGYAECIEQFMTTKQKQIESTYAELDIARLLTIYSHKLNFNVRKNKQGEDFDLLITCPNGIEVCAEAKCKLEETPFTVNTLSGVLKRARYQNLPHSRPGMIFARLPQKWIEDETGHQRVVEVTSEFLRNTTRIVSVKYYTSFVGEVEEFPDQIVETLAWYEITNPHNRFDAAVDWQLFPGISDVVKTWNGRPPHWKPITKAWPVAPARRPQ
jgi:hypothetical protein